MVKDRLIKIITASLLVLGAGSAIGATVFNTTNTKANASTSVQTYYSSVNGRGQTLLTSLYNKIKNNTDLGYSGLWTAYQTTDIRSDGKIYDIYSDATTFTPSSSQCGTYSGVGDCYNREHTIPKSWWGEAQSVQGSDLIIVVPSDGKINGMRSNYPYGEVSGGASWKHPNDTKSNYLGSSANTDYVSGTVFEPFDDRKGDIARIYFYAATRYYENPVGTNNTGPVTNWTNFDGSKVFGSGDGTRYGFQISYLSMLLKWHREDPVSAWEIQRNNLVEDKQGNRNPFIDHPSYVDLIWGGTYGAAQTNGESTNSNSTVVNGVITTSGTPTPITLSSIAVSNPKISYNVNDTFVKPTVTATFSDFSTANVTDSAIFSGYDLTTTGTQTVNVSYTYGDDTATTSYQITVSSGGGSGSGNSYDLVTSTSNLSAGDVVLFGCKNKNVVAGSLSSSYLTSEAATFSTNSITSKGNGVEFTLGKSGNNWTFTSSEGTLKSSAAKNVNYSSGTGTWTISISSGTATITNTTSSYGSLQYNASSPRFTTYSSGQTSIELYKKTGQATTPTLSSITLSDQTTSFNVGDTFVFDGTVTATYSNGSTADVTSSTTFSGYDMSTAGTQEVTASYTEGDVTATAKYNIAVTQQSTPSGDTYSVTLSSGTYASGSITWKSSDGHTTITQTKANSDTNVNSNYISEPRIYKGHVLSFVADTGYKILSISITYSGSYKGNSMTAGTTYSNNTVTNNTAQVSRTWATGNNGTHVVGSVSSSGLSAIYIQNVATTNVQLRPTAISITYVASSTSQTAETWAASFLTLITCNGGTTPPSTSNWATTRTNFLALSTAEQNNVNAATANENGTDLQKAIARYTFIVNKYTNRTSYPDYLNKASQSNMMMPIHNNTTTIILVVICVMSSLSGMTLVIWLNKKKKEN